MLSLLLVMIFSCTSRINIIDILKIFLIRIRINMYILIYIYVYIKGYIFILTYIYFLTRARVHTHTYIYIKMNQGRFRTHLKYRDRMIFVSCSHRSQDHRQVGYTYIHRQVGDLQGTEMKFVRLNKSLFKYILQIHTSSKNVEGNIIIV